MARRGGRSDRIDPATQAFLDGSSLIYGNPLFAPLAQHAHLVRREDSRCPADGWAVVSQNGAVELHPKRRAEPEEWAWVIAHCLLHLGFGHFVPKSRPELWNLACDAVVGRFLTDLKLGRRPLEIAPVPPFSAPSERALYEQWEETGPGEGFVILGTAGPSYCDLIFEPAHRWGRREVEWQRLLAEGLRAAVAGAVDVAGGAASSWRSGRDRGSVIERSRAWFISHYPLLGALASAFELVTDAEACRRMEIAIAAVDDEAREIYCNPNAGLAEEEWRFVMAHELLHAGLRHQARRQGRDPWLWNVACDFVINGWLIEMEIGKPPVLGLLLDAELKALSAEQVYDRIATDLRRLRKVATLRGPKLPDLLPARTPRWWELGAGLDLDGFYRDCLTQGLAVHQSSDRGLLPAGLVEEIRALDQPPIAWDVELAQWFDHRFPPRERRRTYARLSRRQAASPDIPRPRVAPLGDDPLRTFAVVLDTSGSMDRKLLAKALGSIASYSMAREVEVVRLVFCDASAYDQGYVRPEEIADRVRVRGRGGTVLQPGLDLLDEARDFPAAGPVLVITDGWCDRLDVRRDHAFLLPAGALLPFAPRGPVFRLR